MSSSETADGVRTPRRYPFHTKTPAVKIAQVGRFLDTDQGACPAGLERGGTGGGGGEVWGSEVSSTPPPVVSLVAGTSPRMRSVPATVPLRAHPAARAGTCGRTWSTRRPRRTASCTPRPRLRSGMYPTAQCHVRSIHRVRNGAVLDHGHRDTGGAQRGGGRMPAAPGVRFRHHHREMATPLRRAKQHAQHHPRVAVGQHHGVGRDKRSAELGDAVARHVGLLSEHLAALDQQRLAPEGRAAE
eukprot:scaffold1255_cov120-Isochrysis_galbana.AAC.4